MDSQIYGLLIAALSGLLAVVGFAFAVAVRLIVKMSSDLTEIKLAMVKYGATIEHMEEKIAALS